MTTSVPSAEALAVCNREVDKLDAGSGSGTLKIYGGTRAVNSDTAPGTTALATMTFAKPAFGDAAMSGQVAIATMNAAPNFTVTNAGTATWFRTFDSAGNVVYDGDVTAASGSGDLKLSLLALPAGKTMTPVALTFRVPTGS